MMQSTGFAHQLQRSGLSITELARRSSVDRKTIYKLLAGGDVTISTLEALATAMGLDPGDLLAGPSSVRFSEIGEVAVERYIREPGGGYWEFAGESVPIRRQLMRERGRLRAVEATDGGLAPAIDEGEVVIFEQRALADIEDGEAVVLTGPAGLRLRRLYREVNGQLVYLAANGHALSSSTTWRIEGVVIASVRMHRPVPRMLARLTDCDARG